MTTFIPTTPPADDPAQDAIPNLAFWPAISLSAFRAGYRIDTTVDPAEARHALELAVREVNAELVIWKEAQGVATLADVPSPVYGDQTAHQATYLSAVYHRAKAQLVQDYRHYDTTNSGHDRADAMDEQADIYLARSRSAIRAILGISRSTVELI